MPSPLSRAESRITAASIACLLILTYLVVWSAASFGDLRGVRFGTSFVDFDAFYLSGRMVWSGTIAKAYAMSTMFAAEMAEGGTTPHLPWTYPPQYNLLTALLVLLPKGLAYLAFIGTSFMAYLYLLHRLAGPQVHRVVILTMPAMMISILIGQNGLLTGALIGAFALASLSGARIAGIPLGLMAIKPHLALGVGLWTLVSGSWRVTVIAAVTLLATLALTTLILGPGIWPAFLAGVHESGTLLASGFYQMTRMTSLYSTAITLGLPHAVAFGLQIALAIAACALIV